MFVKFILGKYIVKFKDDFFDVLISKVFGGWKFDYFYKFKGFKGFVGVFDVVLLDKIRGFLEVSFLFFFLLVVDYWYDSKKVEYIE